MTSADGVGEDAQLTRAARPDPDDLVALVGLGLQLQSSGRLEAAEQSFRQALSIRGDEPTALAALGGMLQLQGRYDDAISVADASLAGRPDCGMAWVVRGDALSNSGRPAAAMEAYHRARNDPETVFEATVRVGKMLRRLGRVEAAIAAFDAAVELSPGAASPVLERGLLKLQFSDFASGWEDYEARWDAPQFMGARGFVPVSMIPALKRSPSIADLAGKRIMLVGEQGVGDQIMFASMLPDLERIAAHVICLCEPRLIGLFAKSFPGIDFINPNGASIDGDAIDVPLAMGSLGAAFRRNIAEFSGTPYLEPGPKAAARWRERLGPRTRPLRVGLSWRGGVPQTNQAGRSVTLEQLRPVLDLPGAEFVSLQYGDIEAEVSEAEARLGRSIRRFPAQDLNDFEELAGLVANLDLIVSVQTTLAHLSGALGKPTLVMISHAPEWRYMAKGERMPWYGSVRLFRQTQPADWTSVVSEVAAATRGQIAATGQG